MPGTDRRMDKKTLILLFCGLLSATEALRILVVFPIASKSHNILGQGLAKHLLEAGHEVVYITLMPRSNLPPKLKEIDVSSIQHELKQQEIEAFKLKNLIGKPNIGDSSNFMFFVYDMHRRFLEHENVKRLLSDPTEKFDVVILEWFFSEILAGIPALFQCPLIWIGTTEAHGQILRIIDEVSNPAYSADLFSTSTPPYTFWERGVQLWKAFKRHWTLNFNIIPMETTIYNSVYLPIAAKRGVSIPSYEEAAYSGSFMFLNSHPSVGTPFRLPQSVKYVGGYHIDREVKPLPKLSS
ncbi:UDP-glycosyltransferase UGT40L1 [Operophtera brumata]|uniref:UDP-glycosyltransferase UGT40L1 n=1 Tax=Operophtera brumata TaxID=104452 RepID=A0A0L7L125_OPEBR|nr:UDP-glycosyltransferase UGT40L1 [Operophtera brumata]